MIGSTLILAMGLGVAETEAPPIQFYTHEDILQAKVADESPDDVSKSFPMVYFGKALFIIKVDGEANYTRRVNHKAGVVYGWAVQVSSSLPVLGLKEVLTLPERSPDWTISEHTDVFEGGKIAVTTAPFPIVNGIVYHWWSISAGDPKGEYRLDVHYQDTLIYSVVFAVE